MILSKVSLSLTKPSLLLGLEDARALLLPSGEGVLKRLDRWFSGKLKRFFGEFEGKEGRTQSVSGRDILRRGYAGW
jgi:hypothetical protein